MTKANLVENVVVGEYGYPIYLWLVDEDNIDVDISSYNTIQVLLRSPDDLKLVTYTASLFSDGTDGRLTFTPASGDLDRPGVWSGIVKLTVTSTSVTKSQPFELVIDSTL